MEGEGRKGLDNSDSAQIQEVIAELKRISSLEETPPQKR